jgi:L-lysine 2,3-aminomutase
MAIKDKKIPSPSEIKENPQSFSSEELNQLKELRSELSKLTAQIGQLYINKIKIEEVEKSLKKQLIHLEKKEADIAKTLSDKYGKGSIDLVSGTFTPMD